MTITTEAFFALLKARDGHFRMESGLHARRWLELDGLFDDEPRIAPFVDALAAQLQPFAPQVICGPQTGGARLAQLLASRLGCTALAAQRLPDAGDGLYAARYDVAAPAGQRIALVDDVISAGSSARATFAALTEQGAVVPVVGALLLMGDAARGFFAERQIAVTAPLQTGIEMWPPQACPLCRAGIALEQAA